MCFQTTGVESLGRTEMNLSSKTAAESAYVERDFAIYRATFFKVYDEKSGPWHCCYCVTYSLTTDPRNRK